MTKALRSLAQMHGVQTSYYDVHRRRRQASPEGILFALRALGAPVDGFQDVPETLRQKRLAVWERCADPVAVVWDGRGAEIKLRLRASEAAGRLGCELKLECGAQQGWSLDLGDLPSESEARVEGNRYVVKTVRLPGALPSGYHNLTVNAGGRASEVFVICAPSTSYASGTEAEKPWGVFLPLYALRTERNWGAGDLSDLEALFDWLRGIGGRVVATLPMLATFLETPFDPSPYSPASRLFWNEFYLDVTRVPELERSPAAQSLLSSGEFQREIAALRTSPLVDYRVEHQWKRKIVWEMARSLSSAPSGRRDAFHRYREENPDAQDYAKFRAACELRRAPWYQWPAAAREGDLAASDFDEEAAQYHLYSQWVAQEQYQSLARRARNAGQILYLDLPLGVHHAGYDVWRHRRAFAFEATGGAPPDAVFTKGQDWNFPPLDPERIRQDKYRYFIACIRHQLAEASMLRIDHIMGLHRLFWIPKGLEAREGVYVKYHAEEFYAILNLESHRYKAEIVGENLGTVPRYVNTAMAEHSIEKMYVVQYELSPEHHRALKPVPANVVASLNTHDMPPFTAFLRGLDLDDRLALGLLNEEGVRAERTFRESARAALRDYLHKQGLLPDGPAEATWPLVRGCLEWLARSRARRVLVNLEDLWEETLPQNVPGTLDSRPNWRRKARYSLEEFSRMPPVLETLAAIDGHRRSSDPRVRGRQAGRVSAALSFSEREVPHEGHE